MTSLASAPVVAEVVRGEVVESVHRGLVVVTDPQGRVEWSVGDPETPIYPRSCLKPIQTLAVVRGGVELSLPQLALACSSHSGEERHLAVVRSTLASAGLTEDDLRNTPDWPYGEAERLAWIAAARPMSSLAQNCSGKHAAMLATCVERGWPTATYLDVHHPVQQLVRDTVDDLGAHRLAEATDGCGAPVPVIALAALARMFGQLAASSEAAEQRVTQAMRTHPELVGGPGRDVSAVIAGVPGAIAKDGAEAVYAIGLPDGGGIALKIADGANRARPVVMAAVLRRLGMGDQPLWQRLASAPVLGHGKPVGAVRATIG